MQTKLLNPETWVDNYSDALFNYAITRVSSSEIAEDLVQETFLAGLRTYQNFRGESSEKTWLIAILKRKIIDHYRKQSRRAEDATDFDSSSPFDSEGNHKGLWKENRAPKAWSDDLNTLLENNEFMSVFQHCMNNLPKKWALCFAMKNLEDFDAEEICKELAISPSNYWVILHRARLQLRECVQKSWLSQ